MGGGLVFPLGTFASRGLGGCSQDRFGDEGGMTSVTFIDRRADRQIDRLMDRDRGRNSESFRECGIEVESVSPLRESRCCGARPLPGHVPAVRTRLGTR